MLANWPWRSIPWQVSSSPKSCILQESIPETSAVFKWRHYQAEMSKTIGKMTLLPAGSCRTLSEVTDPDLGNSRRSKWHPGLAFRCVCSHYISGRDNSIPQLGAFSEDGAAQRYVAASLPLPLLHSLRLSVALLDCSMLNLMSGSKSVGTIENVRV